MVARNLIEVRKNHSFNINNLQVWLLDNIKTFGTLVSIKQFIGGQSTPLFLLLP